MLRRILTTLIVSYKTPITIVVALQVVATIASLFLASLNADIIDNGVVPGDKDYIVRIFMLGVSLLQVGASTIAVYFASRTAMGFGRDLRSAIFGSGGPPVHLYLPAPKALAHR